MARRERCRWCSRPLGLIVGDYCSADCLQRERADLFHRDKTAWEIAHDVRWPRYCAEIPPEIAAMLDAAQARSMGVNRLSATRAGMVRAALVMYANALAPMPEPAVEGSGEFVEEPLVLAAG